MTAAMVSVTTKTVGGGYGVCDGRQQRWRVWWRAMPSEWWHWRHHWVVVLGQVGG
jgi:hypothetical protein